jgi:hypothetical protein
MILRTAACLLTGALAGCDPNGLYQTNPGHTGSIAIQAASSSDSVVAGRFAFEAERLGGTGVRRVSGRFRVRYLTAFP